MILKTKPKNMVEADEVRSLTPLEPQKKLPALQVISSPKRVSNCKRRQVSLHIGDPLNVTPSHQDTPFFFPSE